MSVARLVGSTSAGTVRSGDLPIKLVGSTSALKIHEGLAPSAKAASLVLSTDLAVAEGERSPSAASTRESNSPPAELSLAEAMPGVLGQRSPVPFEAFTCSAGTQGHPYHCGPPCHFAASMLGCSLGDNCPCCHLCALGTATVDAMFNKQELAGYATALPADGLAPEQMACPSVGSLGHPHSCNLPCKFHRKANGCKDGQYCVRCHLCHWTRGCKSGDGRQSS